MSGGKEGIGQGQLVERRDSSSSSSSSREIQGRETVTHQNKGMQKSPSNVGKLQNREFRDSGGQTLNTLSCVRIRLKLVTHLEIQKVIHGHSRNTCY